METGLLDFHKMNITVLKMFYIKQKQNTAFYRNYKKFDSKKFRANLENDSMRFDINNIEFETSDNILSFVLNSFKTKTS